MMVACKIKGKKYGNLLISANSGWKLFPKLNTLGSFSKIFETF